MQESRPGVLAAEGVMEPKFPLRYTGLNVPFNLIQTQAASGISLTSSTTVPTFTATNFTLSGLDQAASLQAVFDQYRIKMIEVSFHPRVSQESSTSANTGIFTTVVDVDDSTTLSSIGSANDFSTALTGRGFDSQVRTFVPHVAGAVYSGAFTSFSNLTSPWIDTLSPNVQHYGIKTAWSSTDSVYTFDASVRVWYQFRNVR